MPHHIDTFEPLTRSNSRFLQEMKNLKHALAAAALVAALGAGAQTLPAAHPMNGRFDSEAFLNFWRSEGWAYIEEPKEGLECILASELLPLNTQKQVSEELLVQKAFDPASFSVNVAQNRHTFYCVDEAGILVFYSLDRVKAMFDRKFNASQSVKPSAQ